MFIYYIPYMEIPIIHEYSDELNVNECRICFENILQKSI